MSSSSESNNEDVPNEESSHDEESDDERLKIREELSSMSFENLIKLKEKLGSKVYNETVFGGTERVKKSVKKEFKRENKNRPREMTSKRPVPLLGNEKIKAKASTRTVSDPRFDPNCGEFNATKFRENFSFVADIKAKELSELKAQLKESTDPKEVKKLKYLIQRMQNQNLEEKKRKDREHLLDEEKQEIKRAKTEMKMPLYSSTKERKARQLVSQYMELKDSGKLDKHLEKRRKKNLARDRKKVDFD
ncbi:ribosomal RNA processing protein 36 homolog [Bradysia coprophila]|uniref:ribosomal RNA processing protein 36 homolog n=1 Tax=Bradysia coprophila TaxID=38358 RepID=UPI00187D993E|nr:ribosomal RNA processing protein 36 homolog [Bradysia coprophila]